MSEDRKVYAQTSYDEKKWSEPYVVLTWQTTIMERWRPLIGEIRILCDAMERHIETGAFEDFNECVEALMTLIEK